MSQVRIIVLWGGARDGVTGCRLYYGFHPRTCVPSDTAAGSWLYDPRPILVTRSAERMPGMFSPRPLSSMRWPQTANPYDLDLIFE